MLLPPALGFSPHPPVSVYGTGILKTIAAFLDSWLTHFPTLVRSASRLWIATRFFLCDSSFACTRLSVPRLCSPQMSPQFCFKIVQESQPAVHRIRISASPRPDLPRADQLYPGNLGYSAERIPTSLSLLIPAFSLPGTPQLLTVLLRCASNAPLPYHTVSCASVSCFSPGHFRRRTSRLVSYYALFECVAASEPTS